MTTPAHGVGGLAGWGVRALACVLLAGCGPEYPWAVQILGSGEEHLGWSVSRAGDVNGDGFGDVVVGAPGGGGAAYVFHGASSGLDTSPAATLHQPGFDDVYDTSSGLFGTAVASAGDVNGDGYDDIIVGTPVPLYEAGSPVPAFEGRADVFHGSSTGVGTTPATVLLPPADVLGGGFGTSVAAAGDLNGDGFGDVVVSAVEWTENYVDSARVVFVFHGTATGLETPAAVVLRSEPSFGGNPWAVDGAGDVDGDGFDDVVTGYVDGGPAHVFRGTAEGLESDPAATLPVPAGALDFGCSVSAAGDVDDDGFDDVVVGAYRTPFDEAESSGAAYLFPGSATGVETTAVLALRGEGDGDSFGHSVSGAGDFDGDGYDDVVIGAPGEKRGRAYVHDGGSGGLDPTPAASLRGEAGAEHYELGYSVSAAGDVNGDGYDDVVVGAPGSPDFPNPGAVYLFEGGDPDAR